MKRKIFALLLAACVCLAGCGQPVPVKAADGLDWDEGWVNVGNVVGVDTPGGLTLRENMDVLSTRGMYYATWSMGEASPYTNADGEEAEIYDGQLYLLLAGYDKAEKARDTAAEWLEMASERYQVENASTDSRCNGQTYSIVTYDCASDTNPYARGASAFGVYRNYAISVELQCQEMSGIDLRAVLAGFLANCHYAV